MPAAAATAQTAARSDARVLTPGELAWIAAIPCALLTLAAIVLLGPALGHAFLMPRRGVLWPTIGAQPQPEEHGRFLAGLLGAPLLAAVVLAGPGAADRAASARDPRARAGEPARARGVRRALLRGAERRRLPRRLPLLAAPHVLHMADARRGGAAAGARAARAGAKEAERDRRGCAPPDARDATAAGRLPRARRALHGDLADDLDRPRQLDRHHDRSGLRSRAMDDGRAVRSARRAHAARRLPRAVRAAVGVPGRRADGAVRRDDLHLHAHDGDRHRPRDARRLRDPAPARAQLARRARALPAVPGDRLLHGRRAAERPLRPREHLHPVADPLRRPGAARLARRARARRRCAAARVGRVRRRRACRGQQPRLRARRRARDVRGAGVRGLGRAARARPARRRSCCGHGRRDRARRAPHARAQRLAAALRAAVRVLAPLRHRRLGAAADAGAGAAPLGLPDVRGGARARRDTPRARGAMPASSRC